jgi:hypothetical protein
MQSVMGDSCSLLLHSIPRRKENVVTVLYAWGLALAKKPVASTWLEGVV